MQIRKDYLKTFRESIVERMEGMGLAKLPILVHSEILFQANFKSHYLVPKGQAHHPSWAIQSRSLELIYGCREQTSPFAGMATLGLSAVVPHREGGLSAVRKSDANAQ